MADGMVRMLAQLSLKTEEEGGRRTPISNGFRSDLKYDDEQYRMVAIEFDKDFLFPGETSLVNCNVLLHSEEEIDYLLNTGSTFIADGPNVIGVVKIRDVIEREKINWSNN